MSGETVLVTGGSGFIGTWVLRDLLEAGKQVVTRTAIRNRSLVKNLLTQGLQNMDHRLEAVRESYPNARLEDWRLVQAGIRVQAIGRSDRVAVYFGTEVFSPADRSLAALLGAAPGASVSVNIALEVIHTCRPEFLASSEGRARMREKIPTFDEDLTQPVNSPQFERASRAASESLRRHLRPESAN